MKIEIDGVSLHGEWRRPAKSGRPSLVFLHDGLGSIESWRDFPALVADDLGLGAFLYDRWGYGRSAARGVFPDDFMDSEAAMLARVLEFAGIGEAILVGHSDGGTIGLLHAASQPGGIRAAIIMSAHVYGDEAASAQIDRFAEKARRDKIPNWLYRFHGDRAPELLSSWTRHWRKAFDAQWNIAGRLGNISIPVLAIHGAKDRYGLPAQLTAITNAAPSVQGRLMPGLGHFPYIEQPEAIARLSVEFLAPLAG